MEEQMNTVSEDQPQVALQHHSQDGTAEVISQEVVSTANVDVDKTLYDAEEFLANFAGLRLENDQLKRSNEELQQQLEKARQDLQELQMDKANLEALLVKEREQHKESLWKVRSEFQKIQEERLQWKEKYLNVCMKGIGSTSGVVTSPSGKIRPGKRKIGDTDNEEFYNNLASTFGLSNQDEQPVAVIILKKKQNVMSTNIEDCFSGERHDIESFKLDQTQTTVRCPPDKNDHSPTLDLTAKKKAMQSIIRQTFDSTNDTPNISDVAVENVKMDEVESSEQNRETACLSGKQEAEEEVKVYVVDEHADFSGFENPNYDSNSISSPPREHRTSPDTIRSPPYSSQMQQTENSQMHSNERQPIYSTEPVVVLSPIEKKQTFTENENMYFCPSFERLRSFEKPEEGSGGPNKAAEEISRLVEIDRNVRVALTAEIKERYERVEIDGHKKYVCKMCQKSFERWCNLNAHITMHLDMKPYVCKICAVRYKLRSILNDHIRAAHLRKPLYRCKTCKVKFKHRTSLQNHARENRHES